MAEESGLGQRKTFSVVVCLPALQDRVVRVKHEEFEWVIPNELKGG